MRQLFCSSGGNLHEKNPAGSIGWNRIGHLLAALSVGLGYYPVPFQVTFRSLCICTAAACLAWFLLQPLFRKSVKDRKAVCFLCSGILAAAALLGRLCESDTLFSLRYASGAVPALLYLWSRTILWGSGICCLFRKPGLIPFVICGVLLIPPLFAAAIYLACAGSVFPILCFAVYLFLVFAVLRGYCRRFIFSQPAQLTESHFPFTALLLFLCWFPYLMVHFPVYGGGGTPNQILMFLGRYTLAGQTLTHLAYEGSTISNHHPILLTLLYGIFFRVGLALHAENLFAFLLSLVNLSAGVCCFAFSLGRIRRYITGKNYLCILLVCCFYPLFGAYAAAVCKDNLFSDVLLVFYTLLFELISRTEDGRADFHDRPLLCAVSLLLPFLKNQGAIIVFFSLLLSAAYFLFRQKSFRNCSRRLLLAGFSALFLYYGLYSRILMPLFRINPGGRQEALSVPFQQTALFYKEHRNMVTAEEEAITDKILPVNDIDYMYRPRRADKIKFMYKQDARVPDLAAYFTKVWFPQFLKAPATYIRAWVLLTDDYFMFGSPEIEFDIYPTLTDEDFGIRRPGWVLKLNEAEDQMLMKIKAWPFISYSMHPALFFVIMTICASWCLFIRRNRYLIVLFPVFLNFLVLLLCPWNGVIRYALPLVYALPVGMLIFSVPQEDEKY